MNASLSRPDAPVTAVRSCGLAETAEAVRFRDCHPVVPPARRNRRGTGNSRALRFCVIAAAALFPAMPHVPSAASAGERPGYSYIELRADISKIENDGRGARSDAAGRLVGFAASWNIYDSWYLKAGYSLERSTFSNAVAGTVLNFRMKQALVTAGGGRFWSVGNGTDLYAEGFVLHSSVNHEVPRVQPANGGPPTVGKRTSVIEDIGFGAAAGARHMLNDATEIEARFDIRTVSEATETAIAVSGRRKLADSLSVGLYASYGDTTYRNAGATAKIGAALRYEF